MLVFMVQFGQKFVRNSGKTYIDQKHIIRATRVEVTKKSVLLRKFISEKSVLHQILANGHLSMIRDK